eukprot:310472_1
MPRKIECVVPQTESSKIRSVLTHHRSVHHLSYRNCYDNLNIPSVAFTFKVVNKKANDIVDILTTYGVSSRFGTLDVVAIASTKPKIKTQKTEDEVYGSYMSMDPLSSSSNFQKEKKKRRYAVHERLAYDEIYDSIDDTLHLTFDYLALVVCGGIIAACGLLNDSAVVVVASMLVSPLMGPIVGMTFGFVIRDWKMFWKSFRNESIGILLLWATGAFMGFVTAPLLDNPFHHWHVYGDNTQIQSRGTWIALGWGCGIAAPSGVALMLGVSNDAFLAVIGVAIAAALLPPIANSGLAMASGVVFYIDPKYGNDVGWEWMLNGIISMLLFLINWALIFIMGIWTFRIKRLHQMHDDKERLKDLNDWLGKRQKSAPIYFKELETHSLVGSKNKNQYGGTSNEILLLSTSDVKVEYPPPFDNKLNDDKYNELQNKVNFLMNKINNNNKDGNNTGNINTNNGNNHI